jgi:aryl-alcohol dehydrogenase-like predicted oxidoreductase
LTEKQRMGTLDNSCLMFWTFLLRLLAFFAKICGNHSHLQTSLQNSCQCDTDMKNNEKFITLGSTDIQVSRIGIGTWSWGDRGDWQFGLTHTEKDIQEVVRTVIDSGINFFDTAESYGGGDSEKLLGRSLSAQHRSVVIATKFSPGRWQLRKQDLLNALRNSIARLGLDHVDLYQLHWLTRFASIESRMDALAEGLATGLTRSIGVSNFTLEQLLRAYDALAKRNVPLASIQIEYNLLHRAPELNGIAEACRKLGITLIAYSPLAMGMLTGKYTPTNLPPSGRSAKYSASFLGKIQPLIHVIRDIGEVHEGKTIAQVALNWLICKGALPIPGAKTAQQAKELSGAMGWNLTPDEVVALDDTSRSLQI